VQFISHPQSTIGWSTLMKNVQRRLGAVVISVGIGIAISATVRVRGDQAQGPPAASPGITAITGATVLSAGASGAGGSPIADAVIVIDGSRIARVGPRTTTPVPANATVIDARGKFVMPGLADMHNHLQSGSFRVQQNTTINLTVLLAHGVTTVFDPSVSLADFAMLKSGDGGDAALLRDRPDHHRQRRPVRRRRRRAHSRDAGRRARDDRKARRHRRGRDQGESRRPQLGVEAALHADETGRPERAHR
jgi:hypothetical protein